MRTFIAAFLLAASVPAAADLGLAPATLDFGAQSMGTTSPSSAITVTNNGTAAATIASIDLGTGNFQLTHDCASLAAGASCTITVTFAPTTTGYDIGTLSVTDDGPGSPQTAALSGNAVNSVTVVPKVGGLTFYSQVVNTSSTPLPVTLTNNEANTVSILSITSSAEFPFNSSCVDSSGAGTLAPGASCTINVSFMPQAVGTRTATLNIAVTAAGGPIAMPLKGIGIAGNPGTTVTVAPNQPCALPSGKVQFSAIVTGTTNTAVSWYVDSLPGGSAASGTITATGLYTAPAAGSHTVRAMSQDPSNAAGITAVTVTSNPNFAIYPFTASLPPAGQQSFQAQVCTVPDGGPVTWTVDSVPGGNPTVGTVTSNGVYTAPPTPGRHTVAVSDATLNKTSGALVTVYSNIAVDFGARTNTAHPIPADLFGYARAESMHSDADRNLIAQAGVNVARLYANVPGVYATRTPDWTQIDPQIQSILNTGQRPLIMMAYTPPFLEPQPNPCGAGNYFVAPSDVTAWAQLAASYVAHFHATFPGMVQEYEIWNEPDTDGLCTANNDNMTAYLSIYAAAVPLMKQQAAAVGETIRVGGPVLAGFSSTWLQALLSNAATAPYVDFVSYHEYLFGPTALNVQWDTYNGNSSMYQATQQKNNGTSSIYNQVSALVKAGQQPGAASTPIYVTEYNTNFSFYQDCCRDDPTFAPVWNALYVTDMLNSVYDSTAPNVPGRLVYFAGSGYPYFCLIGVVDANLDCLYSAGATPVPYPQYYTYQLIASPNYLGLLSGGYMAAAISPPTGSGGIAVSAFYDATQDAILITNPTGQDYPSMQVTAQNTGYTAPNATLYQIVNGQSINSSSLTLTPQGPDFAATISVPRYSVQAISIKGN